MPPALKPEWIVTGDSIVETDGLGLPRGLPGELSSCNVLKHEQPNRPDQNRSPQPLCDRFLHVSRFAGELNGFGPACHSMLSRPKAAEGPNPGLEGRSRWKRRLRAISPGSTINPTGTPPSKLMVIRT